MEPRPVRSMSIPKEYAAVFSSSFAGRLLFFRTVLRLSSKLQKVLRVVIIDNDGNLLLYSPEGEAKRKLSIKRDIAAVYADSSCVDIHVYYEQDTALEFHQSRANSPDATFKRFLHTLSSFLPEGIVIEKAKRAFDMVKELDAKKVRRGDGGNLAAAGGSSTGTFGPYMETVPSFDGRKEESQGTFMNGSTSRFSSGSGGDRLGVSSPSFQRSRSPTAVVASSSDVPDMLLPSARSHSPSFTDHHQHHSSPLLSPFPQQERRRSLGSAGGSPNLMSPKKPPEGRRFESAEDAKLATLEMSAENLRLESEIRATEDEIAKLLASSQTPGKSRAASSVALGAEGVTPIPPSRSQAVRLASLVLLICRRQSVMGRPTPTRALSVHDSGTGSVHEEKVRVVDLRQPSSRGAFP